MRSFGLIAPFAAALINRFGVRAVVVAAIGMVSTGVLASLAMTQLWQLVALWGVLIGLGTGMVALVLGATVAARWFHHRRGLVVGMLTASTATGQLVFLPLLAKLTEDYGWRVALVFVVVMLLLAGSSRCSSCATALTTSGSRRSARRALEPPPAESHAFGAMLASPLRALYEARASRTFWVLFATFFVCGLSTNGLIQTHWISLCGDYGVAPVAAAGALAAIGAFDFVGTILSGWLSDRFDNRWLLFVYYGLRGLSLIVLPFTDFSVIGLSAFAVFYGLDWVATVPPTVRLTVERFGAEKANLTFGWIFAAHQLGAATAAFGAGALPHRAHDLSAGALCRGRRLRYRRRPGADHRPPARRRHRSGCRLIASSRGGFGAENLRSREDRRPEGLRDRRHGLRHRQRRKVASVDRPG